MPSTPFDYMWTSFLNVFHKDLGPVLNSSVFVCFGQPRTVPKGSLVLSLVELVAARKGMLAIPPVSLDSSHDASSPDVLT